MTLNDNTISELIRLNENDKEILDFIYDITKSFECYYCTVYEMEMKSRLYNSSILGGDAYQEMVTLADQNRTFSHDALIVQVEAMNNLASAHSLPPVYDGVVSREKPYRRMLADAVFQWMEEIIKNRV